MRMWPMALLLGWAGCAERPAKTNLSDRYATPLAPPSAEVRSGQPFAPLPEQVDVDPKKAALGARLFHDVRVSGDGRVACSSCHALDLAGTDRRARPSVPGREPMPVNVPTVLNVAFNFRFGWNGRFDDIGAQIDTAQKSPLAMGGSWEAAAAAIGADADYVRDFAGVYPEGLTDATIRDSLVLYCLSLVTPGAPFDAFLLGKGTLSEEETSGYHMFQEYGCASCHQGTNVGGNLYERFGVMGDYFGDRGGITKADYGLYTATEKEEDRHVFRVPSLRNVALTGPYFHDGSATTLESAVKVMAEYQLGRTLTDVEASDIAAFLRSLSGRLPEAPS